MTIQHEESDSGQATTRLTFSLPNDGRGGDVSVVGSFNDWTPGRDPLEPTGDGLRSAVVDVPADADVHFRYLGSNGEWFDDPDADEITGDGGTVRPHRDPVGDESSSAGHHTVAEAAAMGPLPGSTSEDVTPAS